jgi:hypothetical protein
MKQTTKTLVPALLIMAFSWSWYAHAAVTPEQEAELKATYLECDRLASCETMLGGDDAAICSQTHEALMKEVFGGSYAKLLEWWKVNKKSCDAKPANGSESLDD